MTTARLNDQYIELKERNENEQKKKVAINGIFQGVLHVLDALNMGFIFSLFLSPVGMALMPVLSPILFPLAALLAILNASASWGQALVKGFDRRSVFSAVKDTLFALIVTTAVVLHFVVPGLAIVTPILFTAFCGSNVLYNGGSAGFYKNKLNEAKDTNSVTKNRGLTTRHLIGVALGVMFLFSVVSLFLLPPLGVALSGAMVAVAAGVGVTAAVAAIALTIMGIAGNHKVIKEVEMHQKNNDREDKKKLLKEKENTRPIGVPTNENERKPIISSSDDHQISGSPATQGGLRQRNTTDIRTSKGGFYSASEQKTKSTSERQSHSISDFRSVRKMKKA